MGRIWHGKACVAEIIDLGLQGQFYATEIKLPDRKPIVSLTAFRPHCVQSSQRRLKMDDAVLMLHGVDMRECVYSD